jgi:uncharacterized membrane protein YfcA
MDFTLYWFMFPVSIVVATCAMLSGIGGAALFTPIFILFLSGFVGYYRRQLIDFRLARQILAVSAPFAIVGALVAVFIHESILLLSYSILVAGLSFVMWRNRTPRNPDERWAKIDHRLTRSYLRIPGARQ